MDKKFLIAVDLDDTLVHTDAVNSRAYQLALKEVGTEISEDYFEQNCSGRHYLDFLPEVLGDKTTTELMEHVHERKKELYSACISAARLNQPLVQILENLHATGIWNTALVTTGNSKNVAEILSHFNCSGLFDLVITAADVTRQKPSSEGYEKAMAYFNVAGENTVIVEDSETGLNAARASGAHVWRIDRF